MKLQSKIWLGVGACIAMIMAVDMWLGYRNSENEVHQRLDSEARIVRALLMSIRRVYHEQFLASGVPLTEKTLGFLPAHAMSRISADFPHWLNSGLSFNNVSDRPRNPGNQADSDELLAMAWFRANPTATDRVGEIRGQDGKSFYHFTAPIWVEQYCLTCHGDRQSAPAAIRSAYATGYGYKLGDLRGVMSIKLPMDEVRAHTLSVWWQRFSIRTAGYVGLLLLLGAMLQRLVARRVARLQKIAQALGQGDLQVRAVIDGNDEIAALSASFNDMADSLATHEQQVLRLNSIYAALSETNQSIVRIDDEAELLVRICRIAVEHGGLRMAWIGRADPAQSRLVPVSSFGTGTDYVDEIALLLDPRFPEASGPTVSAWRDNRIVIVQDFFAEASTQPWHAKARSYGWGGSAAFPIIRGSQVHLVLTLYHGDKNAFDSKILDLLAEMAMDIGYALDRIDLVATQKQLYATLRESEDKYRTVVTTAKDGFWLADAEGRLLEVNDAYIEFSGYSRPELLNMHISDLEAGETQSEVSSHLARLFSRGQDIFETLHRTRSGLLKPVEISATYRPEQGGRVSVFIRDLSTRNEAQARIQRLAHFDTLTGLGNRALFLERLDSALLKALREGRFASALLINIDRFKDINEARGLAFGDALLKRIGDSLSDALSAEDMLARLDSDEFALLLPNQVSSREELARLALGAAEKLRAILFSHLDIDGETVHLEASIGIALFPESPQETASDVLRQADMAMHQAKNEGGNRVVFFEAAMGEMVRQRYTLERELRRAVGDGQLRLYLQTQVDAAGHPVSAEALVRWAHPERGLVAPGEFIPLAEVTDLIVAVDRWMLAAVCRVLATLQQAGHPLPISVNVSPRHFVRSDFVDEVKRQLQLNGTEPTLLVLEVTEGLVIGNVDDVVAKMQALTALGIRFSMDDFGTGYSSLAYLKRLPIHELKIDKSFIQDAPTDTNDGALVETILAVAKHLQLRVVAEGVETQAQADFLNTRATVIHQGYLYARPEPESDWLAHMLG